MTALAAVAPRLRCPACGEALAAEQRMLTCASGHHYDIARHGYVSLLGPRGAAAGDTSAMVAARVAFLGAGHFAPIAAAVSAAVSGQLVVDLGAGTGYYLAAALGALPDSLGIALDASAPALRRAARADPRIAAVACDIWQELPLADASADVVLNVFAPRNGPEIRRILAPGGAVVVVTPTERHLMQLADLTIGVEPRKRERLHATLAPLRSVTREPLEFDVALNDTDVHNLIAMGPSAHHTGAPAASARTVTVSVAVETFRG